MADLAYEQLPDGSRVVHWQGRSYYARRCRPGPGLPTGEWEVSWEGGLFWETAWPDVESHIRSSNTRPVTSDEQG